MSSMGKVGAVLGVLVAALALSAPAGAAQKRVFEENLGSAAQPVFGAAKGMAVDSAGDLLVIDTTTKTVSRWHSDGTPANFSALGGNAIDGKRGAGGKTRAECGEEAASCDETPGNGGVLSGLNAASEVQVAVDASGGLTDGDIYVTNSGAHAIDVFASSGAFLGRLTKYRNGSGE